MIVYFALFLIFVGSVWTLVVGDRVFDTNKDSNAKSAIIFEVIAAIIIFILTGVLHFIASALELFDVWVLGRVVFIGIYFSFWFIWHIFLSKAFKISEKEKEKLKKKSKWDGDNV